MPTLLAAALVFLVLLIPVHAQIPAGPASTQERKVFEAQENLSRIAWVDETTMLAGVQLPAGLQIRLINIATEVVQGIGQGGCASMSVDRSRAAWVEGPGNTPTGDVWVYEIRTKLARRLAVDALQEGDPILAGGPVRASCLAWSPDGSRVAMTTGGVLSRGPLLIVAVASGQVQRKVESDGLMLGYPAWSPDGERLAFTSARFAGSGTGEFAINQIETFDLRRRARSKLVDVPSKFGAENLVYSPDGRELLFDARVDRPQILAYDGSRLRRVTVGTSPTWHPDGRSLTFVRGRSVFIVGQ